MNNHTPDKWWWHLFTLLFKETFNKNWKSLEELKPPNIIKIDKDTE